jgi:hypothetical protein
MKCFYHNDKDAVGTCRSCDKGLCPDCAVDLTEGLACRGHCEATVRGLIAMRQESLAARRSFEQSMQTTRTMRRNSAGFAILLGALLVGFGLFQHQQAFLILGPCFLAFGVWEFIKMRSGM